MILMLAAFAALATDPWTPRPGTLGLLTPPHVASPAGCSHPAPGTLAVHAEPGGRALGAIRFTLADEEDCESVQAWLGDSAVPLLESSYEEIALIVLESRDGWHRIDGAGWVQASKAYRYDTLEALLRNGLAYPTSSWNGMLCTAPATGCKAFDAGEEPSVQIRDARTVGGQVWWRVQFTTPACGEEQPPRKLGSGWLPSHGADRVPTVWFYSRGC